MDTLSDWVERDAKAAGVVGVLHELRHTFRTALVQSGVRLYDVKILACHSSVTVTEKYAPFAPGAGRSAVSKITRWARAVAHCGGTVGGPLNG